MKIELPFNRVSNPATWKQVNKMRGFDLFFCEESNSQIMKRLDSAIADEAISALEGGEEVVIE